MTMPICETCLHRAVCGKYAATGGVKKCRHHKEERHGRWIPLEYDGYADGNPVWDLWECSECQEEHSGDEDTLTPYCPNCGAKMDGGNVDV